MRKGEHDNFSNHPNRPQKTDFSGAKTNLMIALCRRIMEKGNGMRLGVLSMGYGREDRRYGFQWVDSRVPGAVGLYGDEPVEIQRALAEYGEGIEVAVCGDRVEGVRRMKIQSGPIPNCPFFTWTQILLIFKRFVFFN